MLEFWQCVRILFLFLGSIIEISLSVWFVIEDINLSGGANIEQLRLHFIFFPSLLIFEIARILYDKFKVLNYKIPSKAIVILSGTTFGIFIIETHSDLILWINWKLSISSLASFMSPYKLGIVSMILQFIISFIITYLLKLIPYVKKVL